MQSTEQNRIYSKQLNIFDLVLDRFFTYQPQTKLDMCIFITWRFRSIPRIAMLCLNSRPTQCWLTSTNISLIVLVTIYLRFTFASFMLVFFFHSEHSFTPLIDLWAM